MPEKGDGAMPKPPGFQTTARRPRVGPMVLPASGREGPPPAWPYESDAPDLWAELWRTPQAVAWDGLGWVRVVARYVLLVLEAEKLNRTALAEARQLEDRLGLTPKALRLLLWTIEDQAPAEVVAVPDERWRQAAAG